MVMNGAAGAAAVLNHTNWSYSQSIRVPVTSARGKKRQLAKQGAKQSQIIQKQPEIWTEVASVVTVDMGHVSRAGLYVCQ